MSSRSLLASVILAVLGLAACTRPVAVIDEASPPPVSEAAYAAAARAGAAVFRIDPQQSLILAGVGRAGSLRRLGHDHAVASEDVQGFIALFDDLDRSHGELVFPLRNLRVDKRAYRDHLGLDSGPTADEIADTYTNMLKVLEPTLYPWAAVHARIASGTLARPELGISVTLHGSTVEYLVPATIERFGETLIVRGTASIRHGDFGLEPYSAAGGLLRVAEEIGVEFHLVARPVGVLREQPFARGAGPHFLATHCCCNAASTRVSC